MVSVLKVLAKKPKNLEILGRIATIQINALLKARIVFRRARI